MPKKRRKHRTPEQKKEYDAQWQRDNRDKRRAAGLKWYYSHKDKSRAARKKYAQDHPEWVKAGFVKYKKARYRAMRKFDLKKYGLTPETYEAIFSAQMGLCALCSKPPGKINLSVDHDHVTDKVRGLLCSLCNLGLGHFSDSSDMLYKAAEYVRLHREAGLKPKDVS